VFAPAEEHVCASQHGTLPANFYFVGVRRLGLFCFVELDHLTGFAQSHLSSEDATRFSWVFGRQLLAGLDSFLVAARILQCVPQARVTLRRQRIISLRDA